MPLAKLAKFQRNFYPLRFTQNTAIHSEISNGGFRKYGNEEECVSFLKDDVKKRMTIILLFLQHFASVM